MSNGYTSFLREPDDEDGPSRYLDAEGRGRLYGELVRTTHDREYAFVTLKTAAGFSGIVFDPCYAGLVGTVAIVGARSERALWAAARDEVNRTLDDGDQLPVEPMQFPFRRVNENGNRRTGVLDARNETAQLSGKLISLDDGREVVQVKLWTAAADGWTEFVLDPTFTGMTALMTVSGGRREVDAWKPAAAELKRVIDAGY